MGSGELDFLQSEQVKLSFVHNAQKLIFESGVFAGLKHKISTSETYQVYQRILKWYKINVMCCYPYDAPSKSSLTSWFTLQLVQILILKL